MRLHARSAAVIVATVAALAGPAAPAARAVNAMTLTDVGSAFSPPVGLAVASPISAPGSITIANATGATHTYRLADVATGAALPDVRLTAGATHTYSNLAPGALLSVQQVGGVSRALVLT